MAIPMIDPKTFQRKVGVNDDGIIGAGTLGAFFRKLGASAAMADELGIAANVHFRTFGILENAHRLAHFAGQCGLETDYYKAMREYWGPTPTQRGYEGRDDLGNTQPGDGKLFMGRGPGMVTGRYNYRILGRKMGIDLERHPELLEMPSIGLHAFCLYWDGKKLNEYADRNDAIAVSRGVNRGNPKSDKKANHEAERLAFTSRALGFIL